LTLTFETVTLVRHQNVRQLMMNFLAVLALQTSNHKLNAAVFFVDISPNSTANHR